jgi:hypothetical protein
MIIQTAEYNLKLVTIFLKWYFFEMPFEIIKILYKYITVISKIYSFLFLIKTFFSPWKNQSYAYPDKGFNINLILKVWTSNIISRIVGAFVRFFTILMGVITTIIATAIGLIVLFIWVTYPVLFFVLIIRSFIL